MYKKENSRYINIRQFLIISLFLIFIPGIINAAIPFRFIAWGDTKDGTSNLAVLSNQAVTTNPAFTLFSGDLVPDNISTSLLDTWKNAINGGSSPGNGMLDKTIPVRGNHDWSSVTVWTSYFDMLTKVATIGGTNYSVYEEDRTFSFDYGNSHFVGIDINTDVSTMTSGQISWLDSDLSVAETRGLTHAFLYWHGPIYPVSEHCCPTPSTSLVNVLNKHSIVSATFHGHEHLLSYVHIDSSRLSNITHPFESFICGNAGVLHTYDDNYETMRTADYSMTLNCPKSGNYCTPAIHGFVTVDVSDTIFTVNAYQKGNTIPVKTWSFNKGGGTDTQAPTAPTNLTATAASASQINLSWTASTDNVGVAGYKIFRGGVQVGTSTSTSYSDTTVQPNTTYSYYMVAYDAANNNSPPSNAVTITTPPGATTQTLTFNPTADTYIQADLPTSNFGSDTSFKIDNSPIQHTLLKFSVSGIGSRQVTSVKLRLYNINASAKGGDFHRVANTTWTEGAVTWSNAPSYDSAVLSSLGPVAIGSWYEVDLTSLVAGDGIISLKADTTSTDAAHYSSKEGTFAPQLVITVAPSGATDTTPPVRSNGSPSGTLASGTTSAVISLSTNEAATCKYGLTANTIYNSLPNIFTTTGGTSHSATVSGLSNGQTYNYYVRCNDEVGNSNTDDFQISFSVVPSGTGATYYVDAINGNDANSGTSETQAWKTLNKASAAPLLAGSKILLKRGGTWSGTLNISKSGTATNNIIIGAYGAGELPIIQNNTTNNQGVDVAGSYVTIENLWAKGIAPALEAGCRNNPKGFVIGFRLRPGSNHITIKNSKATGNYAGVYIELGSSNNLISNNTIQDNNMMNPLDTTANNDAGAFGVLIHGTDNEISYNTFSGQAACTYDYGTYDGSDVEIYRGQRNKIHHNISTNSNGFSELGGDATTKAADNTYAYNMMVSNLSDGHFLTVRGSGVSYGPTYRTKVYNNTVYVTGSSSQGVVCHAGCSSEILTLKNNILWADWKAAYADAPFDEANNIYWKTGGSPLIQGFTPSTTSKKVDPQFVTTGSDFHLNSISPAINAGTNEPVTAGFNVDLDGNIVPVGSAPDIGAYEFQSAVPSVTLSANLTANPLSGTVPLTTTLSADVSGTASGTINYNLWWNCTNTSTNVGTTEAACGVLPAPSAGSCSSNTNGYKCNSVNTDPQTVSHVYAASGTYIAKVIAERGTALPAEAQTTAISVNNPSDVTPPTISNVSTSNITQTSATITWITDEPATSQVEYGLTTAYGSQTTLDSNLATFHSQALTTLSPGTLYNFRVLSQDGAGNQSVSINYTFTTLAPPQTDTTPPAKINNLTASNITETSADLSWTSPGDDGNQGTTYQYDIRYSTASISEANWSAATQTSGEPTPQAAGNSQSFTLVGLNPSTNYYFAIKASDEVPNWSEISNIVSAATLTPPLKTLAVSLTANPSSGTAPLNRVDLTATVSGTAQGNINYTFYCDRSDTGTNITSGYTKKVDNTSQNSYTVNNACNFTSPGQYGPKVIVERGAIVAEVRINLFVTEAPTPPPPGGGGGGGGGSHVPPTTDTIPPQPVTNFQAQPGDSQVLLTWQNPADSDFVGVRVLRKTSSYPVSPTDGTLVYDGKKNSSVDTKLNNAQTYYYTIFTYDKAPNYSQGVTAQAVPKIGITSIAVNLPGAKKATSGIPNNYKFTQPLSFGKKNTDVTYLQIFLRDQGTDIYPQGLVTGYYGNATRQAVINFQIKYGIVSSASAPGAGTVGPKTQAKINEALGPTGPSEVTSGFNFTKLLYLGQKNDDVSYLQTFLTDQGPEIYPEGLVTGYFGPLTKGAVIKFQVKYGIIPAANSPAAGLVGPKTRAKINGILGR